MSLPPALQNKNVQIGVIAVAILIALVFLFTQLMGGNSTPDASAYLGTNASPYGGPGGPPGGTGGTGAPGGPPGYPMGSGSAGYPMGSGSGGYPGSVAGGYGTDTAAGGAPLTGAGRTPTKKAGPRPPARRDPFKAPTDQMVEPPPISASLPASNGLYLDSRYKEIATPSAEQFIRDTPDPPMRMAGALFGNRVYGVLEINGQTQVVNPGDRVGIYRVERVERDKIVMSRPGRKGRRTVEAPLAGNPALANQYPTGDSGIPGGPTGYGGPTPGGGGSGGSGSR
jgi:hypothetical protein